MACVQQPAWQPQRKRCLCTRDTERGSLQVVADKTSYALSKGVSVILCVGETLEEREAGKAESVIADQLQPVNSGIKDWKEVVIAYEPVWAIGTGKVATPDQVRIRCPSWGKAAMAVASHLLGQLTAHAAGSALTLLTDLLKPAGASDTRLHQGLATRQGVARGGTGHAHHLWGVGQRWQLHRAGAGEGHRWVPCGRCIVET